MYYIFFYIGTSKMLAPALVSGLGIAVGIGLTVFEGRYGQQLYDYINGK